MLGIRFFEKAAVKAKLRIDDFPCLAAPWVPVEFRAAAIAVPSFPENIPPEKAPQGFPTTVRCAACRQR